MLYCKIVEYIETLRYRNGVALKFFVKRMMPHCSILIVRLSYLDFGRIDWN